MQTSNKFIFIYKIDDEIVSDSEDIETKYAQLDDVDEATMADIIAKHFERTCNLCPVDLKSFEQAVQHYRSEHNIARGYLSCCGLKLNKASSVRDHVRWHLNPNVFK